MKLKLALLIGLMFAAVDAAEPGADNDNLPGNDFLRILCEQVGAITHSGSRYDDAMTRRNERIAARGIVQDSFATDALDQSDTPLGLTRESSIKLN